MTDLKQKILAAVVDDLTAIEQALAEISICRAISVSWRN